MPPPAPCSAARRMVSPAGAKSGQGRRPGRYLCATMKYSGWQDRPLGQGRARRGDRWLRGGGACRLPAWPGDVSVACGARIGARRRGASCRHSPLPPMRALRQLEACLMMRCLLVLLLALGLGPLAYSQIHCGFAPVDCQEGECELCHLADDLPLIAGIPPLSSPPPALRSFGGACHGLPARPLLRRNRGRAPPR